MEPMINRSVSVETLWIKKHLIPINSIQFQIKWLPNQESKNPLYLQGVDAYKLVAGVGFEPTAFRL